MVIDLLTAKYLSIACGGWVEEGGEGGVVFAGEGVWQGGKEGWG